jgi:hypothetical protein
MSENFDERRDIVKGITGAGRSNLADKILDCKNNEFRVSYSVESVTSKVETAQSINEIDDREEEESFKVRFRLKAFERGAKPIVNIDQ